MRDIIDGFRNFDRIDWMFFIFLGICNLYMLALTFACLFLGGPLWLGVVLLIATVGMVWGYIDATRYAMGF